MKNYRSRTAVCVLYLLVALVAGGFTAQPASAQDTFDDETPGAFVRVAPGLGVATGSNDVDGPAVTFSFGVGGYVSRSFAIHLTGAGTIVALSQSNRELYYYGAGAGVTYFPIERAFISASAIYGNLQTSASSEGNMGPGAEFMIGYVWGEGSMKYGVSLGAIAWAVEPEFSGRVYGIAPAVCLTMLLK